MNATVFTVTPARLRHLLNTTYRAGFHCHLVSNGMEYEAARVLEQSMSDKTIVALCLTLNISRV